jgi:hypothetical protein
MANDAAMREKEWHVCARARETRNAASEASQKPSVGPSKYELQGPTR